MSLIATKIKRFLPFLALVGLVSSSSRESRADFESWNVFEYRLPLIRHKPDLGRLSLRIQSEFRFNGRSNGLHQAYWRVGPLFDLTPWLLVAVQGTVYSDRMGNGSHQMEVRAELEPNLHGRLGPFTINDRNRVEFRYRDTSIHWRYRNQLRVNLAPKDWPVHPFVWDEVIFDLEGPTVGLQQNRASIGIGIPFYGHMRFDIGYLLRHRLAAATTAAPANWTADHAVWLQLFIDVPPL